LKTFAKKTANLSNASVGPDTDTSFGAEIKLNAMALRPLSTKPKSRARFQTYQKKDALDLIDTSAIVLENWCLECGPSSGIYP
jgi:hypothetical protein